MKSRSTPSKGPETKPRPIRDAKPKAYRPNNIPERQVRLSPSEKTVDEGWHPEEREHHRIERRYWWLTAILTFIAVVGAIATVVISIWGLQEARKATTEARRQADTAYDTERRQLRAYLSIGKVEFKPINSEVGEFHIQVKNGGVTPATHVETINADGTVPYPLDGNKGIPMKFGDSPLTYRLFGGVRQSLSFGPSDDVEITHQIFRSRLKDITGPNSKFSLVVYGAIYYDDVFDRPHFTKYCFFVTPNVHETGPCREGNEAN